MVNCSVAVFVVIAACFTVYLLQYFTVIDLETFTVSDLTQLLPESVSLLLLTKPGTKDRLFTKDELKDLKFKCLAIAGDVFDVTKGDKHYGKDGHYNFFTGIDGTQAYVTGDFTEKGLIDDVSTLDANAIQSIEDWRLMYHKDYTYKGKLIGNFYNENGQETAAMQAYKQKLKEAAKAKIAKKEFDKLYPPCNSEFKNKASRVWCSTLSGGISRSWVGVPRKLFTPKTGEFRCACVRTTGPPSSDLNSKTHTNNGDLSNPNLREYDNCSPTSESCPI